jgi:hypothetical protein
MGSEEVPFAPTSVPCTLLFANTVRIHVQYDKLQVSCGVRSTRRP